ncbi:MAG: aminoacyl-tRNA hydrolase [Clostridiales bacterium]|jgi:PTH1 family peptidyl-tRNA hydrolase|nr:aminoacyl-tRNA hydrolase [Clostridiales bacterium]
MLIIVGLGNPGSEYSETFHNAGFLALDELAKLLDVNVKDKECKALTGKLYVKGEKIVLAKPQTYMNLSGDSVRELAGKYGAKENEILTVYDDADIPLGTIRIRADGSAGTHNGMRDVILKAGYVPRIRIGIKKDTSVPLRDYVLGRVGGEDMKLLTDAARRAAEAVKEYIYARDFAKIMRGYSK